MDEFGAGVDNLAGLWITGPVVHKNRADIWGFLCGSPGLCVDWHRIATYGRWISGYVWWITTGPTNTLSRSIPRLSTGRKSRNCG